MRVPQNNSLGLNEYNSVVTKHVSNFNGEKLRFCTPYPTKLSFHLRSYNLDAIYSFFQLSYRFAIQDRCIKSTFNGNKGLERIEQSYV